MNNATTVRMASPETCLKCGRILPPNARDGICPECARASTVTNATDAAQGEEDGVRSIPTRVGHYELIHEIARGGMGIVYRARDTKLNRTVALKMIVSGHRATAAELSRFQLEAEASARLEHPGIVPIYETSNAAGQPFFTMKLVEGGNLSQAIAGTPLPPERAAQLLAKVARAVQYAHERGVLHRDLKPSNILLDAEGEPRLTDFGLAKVLEDQASGLTQTSVVMGSASYMAPEQARGQNKQLTTATDTYSLGAVLYEALTGQVPFAGETFVETLRKVTDEEPRPPSQINPIVDRDLETICLKCLEKEPTRRYSSAGQLAQDLERWQRHEPVLARPASTLERIQKWARRKPAHATLVLSGLVALVGLILGTLYHNARLNERLRALLIAQARTERFLHHRDPSLQLLGEAAMLKQDPSARAEAILTICQPSVRLVFERPFGTFALTRFSPDGTLYAAGGDVPEWQNGKVISVARVRVWEVPSGALVSETAWNEAAGPFAFSPDSRRLAVPQGTNSIVLWEPRSGRVAGTIPKSGAPWFSPDGLRLALSDRQGLSVFRVSTLAEEFYRTGHATIRAFSSPGGLVLHEFEPRPHGQLRRWNFESGTDELLSPANALASVSAGGKIAAWLHLNDTNLDQQLILQEIDSNRQISSLPTLQPKTSGILSPNGQRIAFASPHEAGRYLIWDVPSGQMLSAVGGPGVRLSDPLEGYRRLGADLQRSHSISPRSTSPWPSPVSNFSQTGSYFAGESRFGERNLLLWDLASEQQIGTLPGASRPVWSADDRWLGVEHDGVQKLQSTNYSFKQSGRVIAQVWEVLPGTPAYRLPAAIGSMAFSADGRQLAAEGTLWNVTTRGGQWSLQRATSNTLSEVVRFASNELWAVDAPPFRNSAQPRFRRLEDQAGAFVPVPLGVAISHAFSPDGRRVVLVCAADRSSPNGDPAIRRTHYQLWDLATRQRLAIWPGPAHSSSTDPRQFPGPVAFSPDGRWVAADCHLDHDIDIRDVATGREFHPAERPTPGARWNLLGGSRKSLPPHRSSLATHLAFTPDNRFLVYAGATAAGVQEVPTGRLLVSLPAGTNSITGFSLSPDGRTLATGTDDGKIRLWEIPQGREQAHWEAHECEVSSLAFNTDGTTLASGGTDGTLKLWNLARIRTELAVLGLNW